MEDSDSQAHSHDDFRRVFDRLEQLLESLPHSLPEKPLQESRFACFLNFNLDPDILEKTGCEVAALSEHLKAVFGWQARTTGDGVVPFTERGRPVCAMHLVLLHFWKRNPDNAVLKKWISDIIHGDEAVAAHGVTSP